MFDVLLEDNDMGSKLNEEKILTEISDLFVDKGLLTVRQRLPSAYICGGKMYRVGYDVFVSTDNMRLFVGLMSDDDFYGFRFFFELAMTQLFSYQCGHFDATSSYADIDPPVGFGVDYREMNLHLRTNFKYQAMGTWGQWPHELYHGFSTNASCRRSDEIL